MSQVQISAKEKFNALANAQHIFAFKEEGTPFQLVDIVNTENGCKAVVRLEDGKVMKPFDFEEVKLETY